MNDENEKGFAPRGWLLRSSDRQAILRSTSGGVSWELGRDVLSRGGVVCGCVWDEDLVARHEVVNDLEGLERTQGSKYVWSSLGTCLRDVADAVESGREAMFTGTPCQCRAMAAVADSRGWGDDVRSRLLISALVCHGVARPQLWERYKEYLERKHGGGLVGACFRDKGAGYGRSMCRFCFESPTKEMYAMKWDTFLSDMYIFTCIVYNLGLRKNCYACNSKGLDQPFDIIMGDWYAADSGEGEAGSSCAISLSSRGGAVLERLFPEKEELSTLR